MASFTARFAVVSTLIFAMAIFLAGRAHPIVGLSRGGNEEARVAPLVSLFDLVRLNVETIDRGPLAWLAILGLVVLAYVYIGSKVARAYSSRLPHAS